MGINVGGGGKGGVTQPVLNLLHGDALTEQEAGTGMPLRYNNDKPEKPRNFKGLEVYQADFSSFSNPKNQATKYHRIERRVHALCVDSTRKTEVDNM